MLMKNQMHLPKQCYTKIIRIAGKIYESSRGHTHNSIHPMYEIMSQVDHPPSVTTRHSPKGL